MGNTVWGTMAASNTGYSFVLSPDGKPEQTPAGLIVTRAVETKKGWRGQVIVDKEIIHETKVKTSAEDAMTEVNRYVINRVKELFSPPAARVAENDDDEA